MAPIGLGENPKKNSQEAILVLIAKYLKKTLKYIKEDVNDVILRQIEFSNAADFVVAAALAADQGRILWETDDIFKISVTCLLFPNKKNIVNEN